MAGLPEPREARSEGKLHDPAIHPSSGTMDGRLKGGHDKLRL